MRSKKTRLIAVITALALLLPLAISVGAEEMTAVLSSSSSHKAYMLFKNVRRDEAVLYVQKKVENANDEFPAPEDDQFEFVLRMNGAVEQGRVYTLYDAEGRRLYKYGDLLTPIQDPTQFEDMLATDRYGRFYLTAGQTAKFSDLAAGMSYEVTESDLDPYTRIEPQGESAVGTITDEGVKVTFRNRYPDAEPGTLEVRKAVSYPEDYEVPGTPEFTFRIEISEEALADYDYVVKDIDTDEQKGTGKTDGEGKFELYGNTYAVFDGIPDDVDYAVEELLDPENGEAGWRVIGESRKEGATNQEGEAGTVVNFSNALASFGVSKKMYGGISVPENFTFQIVDGNGQSFKKQIGYYLYDGLNKLVSPDIMKTAEDGTFTLYADQTAIFIGLEKDTAYGVRELSSGKYVQYLPAEGDGYSGKIVLDSVEILPFVNAVVPEDTLLTVKKQIVDESEDGSAPKDALFTFKIEKKEGDEYVPVSGAAYDIVNASGTSTYSADADGVFKLQAYQTARFVDLEKGVTYRVSELAAEIPPGFLPISELQIEALTGDDLVEIVFTNMYQIGGAAMPLTISVVKKDDEDSPLSGAKLELYQKVEDDDDILKHTWVSGEVAETITDLDPGIYYIHETEAPEGYVIADDVEVDLLKENYVLVYEMIDDRDPANDVPGTGGRGTAVYYIVGGVLIAAACVLTVFRRKKKVQ